MILNDIKTIANNIDDFIEVPDGINRLRKAILTLAMSGKLVPQDKKEGTGEELFNKIKSECLKNDTEKKLLNINEEEIPFEIPISWKWTRLNNLSDINGGYAFKSQNFKNTGVRVIKISDFDENGFKNNKIVRHDYYSSLAQFEINNENILLCMTGGTVGKSYFVRNIDEKMVTNQRVATIKINDNIISEYINYVILSSYIQDFINKKKNSTNDNISMDDIKSFVIPLPPYKEQNRIVKKIEEVIKQLDKLEIRKNERDEIRSRLTRSAMQSLGKGETKIALKQLAELVKTPEDIKELEDAILSLAVSGKLVPQDKKEGTAEDLLSFINIEKKRIEINDNKKKKNKESIFMDNKDLLFEIPKSWKWVKLGDVFSVERGGSPRPIESYITNNDDGLNWIKIGDTEQGGKYIYSTKEKIIKAGLKKTRMVHVGDLLLTNSMSFGRPYILKIDGCIHDGWLVLKPYYKETFRDFFYYMLSSNVFFQQFADIVSGAVVKNLNAEKVKSANIPLPPLAEQKRIVKKIEEIMVLINQLRDIVDDNKIGSKGRLKK